MTKTQVSDPAEYLNKLLSKPYKLLAHPGIAVEALRGLLEVDRLRTFYYRALIHQEHLASLGLSPNRTYYEFGVGGGGTLTSYLRALKSFCRHFKVEPKEFHIFGFDSFEGLPPKASQKDDTAEWTKGKFSHALSEINLLVYRETRGMEELRPNIRFVKGYFDNTLTNNLRDELSKYPPAVVTIDVDYYSSTKVVLNWLEPILHSGCLFYFDDIWSFHGNPDYGELAAINEFNKSGKGYLTLYPVLSTPSLLGHCYIFSRKEFEYRESPSL